MCLEVNVQFVAWSRHYSKQCCTTASNIPGVRGVFGPCRFFVFFVSLP